MSNAKEWKKFLDQQLEAHRNKLSQIQNKEAPLASDFARSFINLLIANSEMLKQLDLIPNQQELLETLRALAWSTTNSLIEPNEDSNKLILGQIHIPEIPGEKAAMSVHWDTNESRPLGVRIYRHPAPELMMGLQFHFYPERLQTAQDVTRHMGWNIPNGQENFQIDQSGDLIFQPTPAQNLFDPRETRFLLLTPEGTNGQWIYGRNEF